MYSFHAPVLQIELTDQALFNATVVIEDSIFDTYVVVVCMLCLWGIDAGSAVRKTQTHTLTQAIPTSSHVCRNHDGILSVLATTATGAALPTLFSLHNNQFKSRTSVPSFVLSAQMLMVVSNSSFVNLVPEEVGCGVFVW
jgi:hypothetical protein